MVHRDKTGCNNSGVEEQNNVPEGSRTQQTKHHLQSTYEYVFAYQIHVLYDLKFETGGREIYFGSRVHVSR